MKPFDTIRLPFFAGSINEFAKVVSFNETFVVVSNTANKGTLDYDIFYRNVIEETSTTLES